MTDVPALDSYRLHEQDWESYEELQDSFEFEIPDEFNMVNYVCDRWADDDEEHIALYSETVDGEETIYTFSELRTMANQIANFLGDQEIGRDARIAVSGSQRVETIVGHLAAWKLGAVSVPLSNLIGPDGLEYRLNDCEPTAFIVDGGAVETLRSVKDDIDSLETVIVAEGEEATGDEYAFEEVVRSQPATFENATTDPEDEAMIIYTSGTTGNPKGVVHAHRGLLGLIPPQLMKHDMQIRDDEVERIVAEWSWVASINDTILPAWYFGKSMVAHNRQGFNPEKEFELIDKYDITILAAPPTGVRMMMQIEDATERYDLDSLRVFACGGEAVGETIEEWVDETFDGAHLVDGLGQTEAPALTGDCPSLGCGHKDGKMGRPGIGVEVKVVDVRGDREEVDRGGVGELAIKYDNPQCFKRYLNKPEKTAKKVQDGWLYTEDLVSMDEEGYLEFESRADDVIISSGYRIGPEEIEDCLTGHEAVVDAGVIGVPHDIRGEIPKAFVTLVDDATPTDSLKSELQEYVKSRLAKYEYPRELEFIETLPTTSSGKLRRVDLRKREGIADD
ncbi:acyl-CoA synthetase [Halosolutus amylolyticus]|uniref:Acyl-CoA synthetase n=1 Tax=Halosolutus amylolyticus TaxID=2932267 RepID=A0ABD5PK12_9EURY|nr:AMP-binding protein [Halosolutus amylolyticus]